MLRFNGEHECWSFDKCCLILNENEGKCWCLKENNDEVHHMTTITMKTKCSTVLVLDE